ncbi:hypothetical protein UlMin_007565 [Ulmus minor]
MEMKVEILSRDLVKPSSPTPNHLRDYKLSLLDQFIPEFHWGIVFFYSPTKNTTTQILKKSLSETLTDFYPIAGRHKDSSTIDCNDEGGYFVEAKINSKAQELPQSTYLDPKTVELASKCLLIVQLTTFECQGVAISFCLDHRFCDFSSLLTFLKNWSARARGSGEEIVPPAFIGASFLPPKDLPPLPAVENKITTRTTTRLGFEASKISALKHKFAVGISSYHPSRVEVVVALIVKSSIAATRSSSSNYVIFQAVNLRKRTEPPLPDNSIGNLFCMLPVSIQENDIEFHELVAKMRRETTLFYSDKVHKIKGDDEGIDFLFGCAKENGEIMNKVDNLNIYFSSSWCKFPVYEIDFGWGKPIWVSNGVFSPTNIIVLGDTKCGTGIEAWVTLDAQVMALFEQDEELLSFASLNPKVDHGLSL